MLLLVVFSPILYYLNWTHPEVYTYVFVVLSLMFYHNKQYAASVSLQILSLILFLKSGKTKLIHKVIHPIEQRALVGINLDEVRKYLRYFGYDYKDLPWDIQKFDKKNAIDKEAFGTLRNVIDKLKE